ncbi:hypothetical protein BHM03_00009844 [Ensete ventricosum]|nr:hypothetical protein BHM03_00009844 [Ensete ventricosum]
MISAEEERRIGRRKARTWRSTIALPIPIRRLLASRHFAGRIFGDRKEKKMMCDVGRFLLPGQEKKCLPASTSGVEIVPPGLEALKVGLLPDLELEDVLRIVLPQPLSSSATPDPRRRKAHLHLRIDRRLLINRCRRHHSPSGSVQDRERPEFSPTSMARSWLPFPSSLATQTTIRPADY